MSDQTPRIEEDMFVWSCGNGHTTDTPIESIVASVINEEITVCECYHPGCGRVFEISDEFERSIRDRMNHTPDE